MLDDELLGSKVSDIESKTVLVIEKVEERVQLVTLSATPSFKFY